MIHDQATIHELKSMFAEMKELLQQQVICPHVSHALIPDDKWFKNDFSYVIYNSVINSAE